MSFEQARSFKAGYPDFYPDIEPDPLNLANRIQLYGSGSGSRSSPVQALLQPYKLGQPPYPGTSITPQSEYPGISRQAGLSPPDLVSATAVSRISRRVPVSPDLAATAVSPRPPLP